ncbi:hypothetical protein F2Q69_00000500 [Brassica cretica]|uniref:Uncharacterized protein n=1 Tax=Brassica cretica TaxID=69181 RepID=A0A8S9P5T1_BRACR|nr:hypothetical protein F2Q69_00000500 [Brassica cretica]
MRNNYSRRKPREHITTVAFIILLLLFLFLYAKASSSSSPAGIHHPSTHGSLKKPRVLDPKPDDLNGNAALRGSRIYTYEGGENVFEDGKRRVFTGDGKTEKVSIIRSGYSSLILDISSVPIPDPVPPPSE